MIDAYFSIVSHNQTDLIKKYFSNFPKERGNFSIKLCFMDNTGSNDLKTFCDQEGHFYYYDGIQRGFGQNHNKMFSLISPKKEDIFIVCNPDILIPQDQLEGILHTFVETGADLFSPSIYFDKKSGELDNPDKNIPGFLNFCVSFISNTRLHYGTRKNIRHPEWLSGAFIVFKPEAYRKLGGFDERYFMYCEDMDICYRAQKMGLKIVYDNRHYLEHHAQMHSRQFFSQNVYWHMHSALKFSLRHNRLFHLRHIKKQRKNRKGPRKEDLSSNYTDSSTSS
ncbi:MAG: hypothetical protein B6D59_02495 [Campylobacteraceae bacterium 4484_4]|nr:MAG: hypothetical protein B6D59_02495 [Campylobacteraceae bacterium 4484_4]